MIHINLNITSTNVHDVHKREADLKLHNRIKEIRQYFDLSQLAMSESLGISRAHISRIETGAAVPSEQLMKLICATWAIDENWLKTGQGQMRSGELSKKEEEEIVELVNESLYDEYIYKSKSVGDYLHYIQSEFIKIDAKQQIDFKVDKNHPSFSLLEIEIDHIRWAYTDLIKTIFKILNKDEAVIDEGDFIQKLIEGIVEENNPDEKNPSTTRKS